MPAPAGVLFDQLRLDAAAAAGRLVEEADASAKRLVDAARIAASQRRVAATTEGARAAALALESSLIFAVRQRDHLAVHQFARFGIHHFLEFRRHFAGFRRRAVHSPIARPISGRVCGNSRECGLVRVRFLFRVLCAHDAGAQNHGAQGS